MKILKTLQIAFCLILLSACSSVADFGVPTVDLFDDESSDVTITLNVDSNLNPDSNGRPSPLVLRVYQLNSDAQFRSLDLTTLYEQDASILGVDLRKLDQVTIFPGNSISYNLNIFKDVQFLGVLGAYQDESNSQPKLVIPISGNSVKELCVMVGRSQLSVC